VLKKEGAMEGKFLSWPRPVLGYRTVIEDYWK
jgi:hypothetical protein